MTYDLLDHVSGSIVRPRRNATAFQAIEQLNVLGKIILWPAQLRGHMISPDPIIFFAHVASAGDPLVETKRQTGRMPAVRELP